MSKLKLCSARRTAIKFIFDKYPCTGNRTQQFFWQSASHAYIHSHFERHWICFSPNSKKSTIYHQIIRPKLCVVRTFFVNCRFHQKWTNFWLFYSLLERCKHFYLRTKLKIVLLNILNSLYKYSYPNQWFSIIEKNRYFFSLCNRISKNYIFKSFNEFVVSGWLVVLIKDCSFLFFFFARKII